jgi:hypothetical protein
MSWSICFIGKPEKVAEALVNQEFSDPNSKVEFEAALPHLVGLVKQNFGNDNTILRIEASGHGYFKDGVPENRNCQVKIESIYGIIFS